MRYKRALAAALYQEGLAIDAKAVKITPVDLGRLKQSHYIGPPIEDAKNMFCEIGFGTKYALAVHELHSTKSKYLEIPFRAAKGGFIKRLARRAKRNFKQNVGVQPLAPIRPNVRGDE